MKKREKYNSDFIQNNRTKENLNQTTIIYEIGYQINLFGDNFVKNNINKCHLLMDGKQIKLCEKLILNQEQKNKNILEIKLIETNKITNMSYMFEDCTSLNSLPDISKWDTKNVTNMSYMFYNCYSLKSLPDISKWDIKNVTNMSCMFGGCHSLKSLPDISKWKLNKELDKENMFEGCNKKIIAPKFKK